MTENRPKRIHDDTRELKYWSALQEHDEKNAAYINSDLMIQDQKKFNALNTEKAELDLFKKTIRKFLSGIQNTLNEKRN